MPFKNKIRLPIKITRPQFPEERSVFRKANGETKTLSVVVRKNYEGETDWMPEKWHERLKIALAHDEVNIEGDKYIGGVSQEGEYDIQWQTFLDYPTAKASFKVSVTPFAATNSNCQTCEEATQLTLADDYFNDAYAYPLTLEEEQEYESNVADNDTICCYPAVFSITSYNAEYLQSATIDQTGLLTIVMNDNLTTAEGVNLVTYRVTCPNGGYDEADVFGDIEGSIEGCAAPTDLFMDITGTTTATITWTAASPVPANGYTWELYEADNPGAYFQNGNTTGTSANLTSLTSGTEYVFYVWSDCGGTTSVQQSLIFFTAIESGTCGEYTISFADPEGNAGNSAFVTYLDCNSDYKSFKIFHLQSRVICAMQNSPGDPVSITWDTETGSDGVTINYESLC